MAPNKALYWRSCRLPLCWVELDDHVVMGPQVIDETIEKICVMCDRLKTVKSHQKSFVGLHCL